MNPKKAKEFKGVGSTKYKGPKKDKIGPITKSESESYGFKNKDISHLKNKYRLINIPLHTGTKRPHTKQDSVKYDEGFKFGQKNHYNKHISLRQANNYFDAGVKEGRMVGSGKIKQKDKK
jgi:hypothetical protein